MCFEYTCKNVGLDNFYFHFLFVSVPTLGYASIFFLHPERMWRVTDASTHRRTSEIFAWRKRKATIVSLSSDRPFYLCYHLLIYDRGTYEGTRRGNTSTHTLIHARTLAVAQPHTVSIMKSQEGRNLHRHRNRVQFTYVTTGNVSSENGRVRVGSVGGKGNSGIASDILGAGPIFDLYKWEWRRDGLAYMQIIYHAHVVYRGAKVFVLVGSIIFFFFSFCIDTQPRRRKSASKRNVRIQTLGWVSFFATWRKRVWQDIRRIIHVYV